MGNTSAQRVQRHAVRCQRVLPTPMATSREIMSRAVAVPGQAGLRTSPQAARKKARLLTVLTGSPHTPGALRSQYWGR